MLLLFLCEELLEESQSQLKISKSTVSESQLPQKHLGRSIYVEILFEQIW